jgi:putative transposase
VVTSQVRRQQVVLAIERGHSQRRAWELMRISRTVLGYEPTGPVRDAPVIDAMRRIASSRQHPVPPIGPNTVWAYDFVFEACATGQQIKCLTVIDEFTRACLAIDVAGSIRSNRVTEVLSRLVSARGAPRYMRSDNSPEFVSHAILK